MNKIEGRWRALLWVLLAPSACGGTESASAVPLEGSGIPARWSTVTDCSSDPTMCTSGGDEPSTAFDGKPFCTTGETVALAPNHWGASVLLSFEPPLDVSRRQFSGLNFTLTGSSPPKVGVSWQSPESPSGDLLVGEGNAAPMGKRTTSAFAQLITPAQSLPGFLLEVLNGLGQIPAHELRVPIDPVQGARYDGLLFRIDRSGEGFHPIRPRACRHRLSPPASIIS